MDKKEIVGMVSGGWDPFHPGHLVHMQLAKRLCDKLVVVVSTDEMLIKKKGYYFLPLRDRIELLAAYEFIDQIVIAIDKDGSVCETLKMVHPDIFCKGGDRTPDNMPQNELDMAKAIGCKIIYGVGGTFGSSSNSVLDAAKKLKALGKI